MIKYISVQGHEFKVDFDHSPEEDATYDYPGCNESVEINGVFDSDGDEIKEWAFDMLGNDLEVACLEAVAIDQEEARMAKEEAKEEAWEARQEDQKIEEYSSGKRSPNWNRRQHERT
jgi:hypothetical protein